MALFRLCCNFHVVIAEPVDEQLDKPASCLDLSGEEATEHSRVSQISLRLLLVSAILLTWWLGLSFYLDESTSPYLELLRRGL